MKIGMLGPVYPYRGGIAHFTTLLAKKLIEAGHEVQVISFKKQYPAWLYPGESDKDHSPGREKVPADYLLTPLNPLSWRRTVRALVAFKPQQVIVPWWVTMWGPAFRYIITRLRRHGIPTTALIHNTMPHEAHLLDRLPVSCSHDLLIIPHASLMPFCNFSGNSSTWLVSCIWKCELFFLYIRCLWCVMNSFSLIILKFLLFREGIIRTNIVQSFFQWSH